MPDIDVHGLTLSEAMAAFIAAYNRAREPFRVVHGYGSSGSGGVIKRELHSLLQQHSDKLTWFAGETIDGNPGYTLVQPQKPLPTAMDQLEVSILKFCSTARTEEKIAGEFRRFTDRAVKATIRRLKKRGLLREIVKNGRSTFES